MVRKLAWLLCVMLLAAPATAQNGDVVTGPARAVDADIITIGTQRVILYGVDAPERSQFCTVGTKKWGCWDEARNTLTTILSAGDVTCTLSGDPDPFNRRYGVCKIGDTDVGAELIRSGMALAFVEQADDYSAVEEEARTAAIGLWQPGAKVDTPWDWRKRNPGGFR
ncbi:MAG: succinoglycan biosynthesis protein [Devosia sp.]|uniref:thermonuclease family protein n=1 Tax=Devosia sp. TaxID=1871048 RepID=UPI002633E11E|nr:thermonuclease family protein [Devosia sp.]MDB5530275.1 succinoglycan biosynthesis protein [Devosia sp.]